MKIAQLALCVIALVIVSTTGCGDSPEPTVTKIDGSRYVLAEEPGGAVGIIAARESVADGSPLVLVGRVGGSANPWVQGRAAFTMLDASMSVVAEGEDSTEDELCLGDCCATERLTCTMLVKVVDEQGKVVSADSRELFGLKESDMVVVKGTAKKDESGNVVMLAEGVYVRR